MIPQLIAVEENPKLRGLLVILNTMGGDVEAGLALAEMIATLSKPTVSLVLGGGHSIGIPLATATDYSFIAGTATMTLHPIRTTGLVITAETTFDYMRKTQDRVIDFIAGHSRATRNDPVWKGGRRRRDHRCSGRRFPGTWGAASKSGKGR